MRLGRFRLAVILSELLVQRWFLSSAISVTAIDCVMDSQMRSAWPNARNWCWTMQVLRCFLPIPNQIIGEAYRCLWHFVPSRNRGKDHMQVHAFEKFFGHKESLEWSGNLISFHDRVDVVVLHSWGLSNWIFEVANSRPTLAGFICQDIVRSNEMNSVDLTNCKLCFDWT